MDFKARRKEEEEEERGREIPRAALSSCSLAKKSNAKFSLLPLVSRTGMNPAQGKKTFAQISVRPGREEGIYIFPSSGAENEGPAPFLFCPPRPSPFFTPQLFAFLSFLSLSFPAREAILITHEKHCGRRRPTDREEEEEKKKAAYFFLLPPPCPFHQVHTRSLAAGWGERFATLPPLPRSPGRGGGLRSLSFFSLSQSYIFP